MLKIYKYNVERKTMQSSKIIFVSWKELKKRVKILKYGKFCFE